MIEVSPELTADFARLKAMNEKIAEQLEVLAADRVVELMTEFAPDESTFIRAIRVPRPGAFGDAPPIIVEDEIVALMQEHPSLVGVMVGRYWYEFSDREDETQKAAHAVVEAGLVIARRIWNARSEPSRSPSP
ncbi:hypothetical protein G6L37_05605 [Agrobacterium rubi]|nr:hypothetical protein [Agrobacterium rubi]NTF24834.1 hypothetical protein [Agrobacterium rubi]